jgi:hypothetical protein
VPVYVAQKMGKRRNSLRCASFKHDAFLSIFCTTQTAAPIAEKAQNIKAKAKAKANENVQLITPHKNRAINRKDHEWKAGSS